MRKIAKALLSRPEISALVMLIVVVAGFQILAPTFLSMGNLKVILGIAPELGLAALGVAILMISGEFDLSVGSVFALTPMLIVVLIGKAGIGPWPAMAIGLAFASLIGLFNGWVTLTFNIPSFVTTLGMLFIARSFTLVLSGGFPPPFPAGMPVDVFVVSFGLIRASLLWYLGVAVILFFFLQRSNFGNWIFATGGSGQAAGDMGINTRRVKIVCFMLCSLLAGFAGIIQTLRLKASLPSLGLGLELEAIAAAVIGGCLLTGGVGSVVGAIIGALLIRSIDNGLIMARVDADYFKASIGALTIIAVILNTYIRRRASNIRG